MKKRLMKQKWSGKRQTIYMAFLSLSGNQRFPVFVYDKLLKAKMNLNYNTKQELEYNLIYSNYRKNSRRLKLKWGSIF